VRIGDSVEAATRKIGQTPRTGTVTAVRGALITVRWDSGDETTLIPAAGTLTVIGAARSASTKKSAAQPAAGTTPKATPKKTTAKKPTDKKRANGR
jgi:Domain of unknown function (DUF1918)